MPQAFSNAKSRKLYRRERLSLQQKLRKLYRLLTGRVWNDYTITDDVLGRMVLIYLMALGIDDAFADRFAPWADISKIRRAAARIKLTRDNVGEVIGRGIGLTWEDRERCRSWAFHARDKTPEQIERLNADKRNKKKRIERAELEAQREALTKAMSRSYPERVVKLYANIVRLWHRRGGRPLTVSDIAGGIAYKDGHLFGWFKDPLRVIRRDVDLLESDGLVKTLRRGRRGVRTVWLADDFNAVAPAVPRAAVPEPWEAEGISRATHFRRRRQRLHQRRETDLDTRTLRVSPYVPPQPIDAAELSVQKLAGIPAAHLYVDETSRKTTNTGDNSTTVKSFVKAEHVTTAVADQASHRVEKRRLTLKQGQKMKMQMRQLRQSSGGSEASTGSRHRRSDYQATAQEQPVTKKRTYTIKPKRAPTAAYFERQIRLLQIQATELERRLKRQQGPAAFAAYQDAVTATVQQNADVTNVVRLRSRL